MGAGGNLNYVKPGDKLSASAWNHIVSRVGGSNLGNASPGVWASSLQSVGQRSAQAVVTTVYNATGHDFGAGEAVPIGEWQMDPTASSVKLRDFLTRSTRTTDGGRDRTWVWGITLEAIKDERVGRVLTQGYTPAKVTKWTGEDHMVDFDYSDSSDWNLYTSAAGCASIEWMEDLEDEAEGWAILYVHGQRLKEPSCWATLDDDLTNYLGGTPTATATIGHQVSGSSSLTTVKGFFDASRVVEVRTLKVTTGQKLASGTKVKIDADLYSGLWFVEDSLSCEVDE